MAKNWSADLFADFGGWLRSRSLVGKKLVCRFVRRFWGLAFMSLHRHLHRWCLCSVQCQSEYSTRVCTLPCPSAHSRWPCPAPGRGPCLACSKHETICANLTTSLLPVMPCLAVVISCHIILLCNRCGVLGSHMHRENADQCGNFLSSLPAIRLCVIVCDAKCVILL